MQIRSILTPHAILSNFKTSGKKRLLKEISQFGSSIFGVDENLLHNALIEREDLGSTSMGSGIAIPHARMDEINSVHGLFIRLEEPIDYEAHDHAQVDLVFALFAPKHANSDHLKALACVSRVLRNSEIRESLRSTTDAEAIFAILTKSEKSAAA